jgi:hypothetical protein
MSLQAKLHLEFKQQPQAARPQKEDSMSQAFVSCPVIPAELVGTRRQVRDQLGRIAKDDPGLAQIIEAELGSEANWNDETVSIVIAREIIHTRLVG